LIIDRIENLRLYKDISPGLSQGLDFIAALNNAVTVGTYQIDTNLKAVISEYETKSAQGCRYETHKKAIDIQYLLKGKEIIRWQPLSSLSAVSEYDIQNDIRFYSAAGRGTDLELSEGIFVIFFPDDGHCPGLALDSGPEPVKKAVVKVSVGKNEI
jgi:biofilm protein TabA